MRLLSKRLVAGAVAAWLAAVGPVAAGPPNRSGYTTLTESACSFTGNAYWTGHPNTTQVKFQLGANFGDGPVVVAETDTTPSFDSGGAGRATASWLLSPASDIGFFWTNAWLIAADGTLLEVLRRTSAKPVRAACA